MKARTSKTTLLPFAFAAALAACKPDAQPPAAPAAGAAPAATGSIAAAATAAGAALQDVVENDPRYVVGISYPPGMGKYPGLARAIADYAQGARAELMQAVAGLGTGKPSAPYELSLSFEKIAETPDLVAIASDGSLYTGGAHSLPLVARFVWLPKRDRQLTSDALVPSAEGWKAISEYVRERLHTQVSVRADADEIAPQDRAEFVRNADKMIDEGTAPNSGSFSQFQPVLDASGKVNALRFVFPPYQVGPYADGTQTVDVPAAVLRPYVAPEYAGLFGG
jgi:hypothetical protein